MPVPFRHLADFNTPSHVLFLSSSVLRQSRPLRSMKALGHLTLVYSTPFQSSLFSFFLHAPLSTEFIRQLRSACVSIHSGILNLTSSKRGRLSCSTLSRRARDTDLYRVAPAPIELERRIATCTKPHDRSCTWDTFVLKY